MSGRTESNGNRQGDGTFGATHEATDTPEYKSWAHMMERCYNPNCKDFKDYGGRGMAVCDRWQDAASFLVDMGEKPSARHTLGRIDNDKGYEPGNCRWETPAAQARNRRTTKLTIADAREIRILYTRGYSQRELATEFDVGRKDIWCIIHHMTWKEDG